MRYGEEQKSLYFGVSWPHMFWQTVPLQWNGTTTEMGDRSRLLFEW